MSRIRFTFDLSDFIAGMIANALLLLLSSYIVMLCLGAAHSHEDIVPALSFWASFWLTLAFQIASKLTIIDGDGDE